MNTETIITKRADAYRTDLGEVLKNNPLRVFVSRTTMRPVGTVKGFNFPMSCNITGYYKNGLAFDPEFDNKKEHRLRFVEALKHRTHPVTPDGAFKTNLSVYKK